VNLNAYGCFIVRTVREWQFPNAAGGPCLEPSWHVHCAWFHAGIFWARALQCSARSVGIQHKSSLIDPYYTSVVAATRVLTTLGLFQSVYLIVNLWWNGLTINWRLSVDLFNISSTRCIIILVIFLPFCVFLRTFSFSVYLNQRDWRLIRGKEKL